LNQSSSDDPEGEALPSERRRGPRAFVPHLMEGRSVGTRALVLVPQPPRGRRLPDPDAPGKDDVPPPALHSTADRLEEATGLARAIDLEIVQALIVPLPQARPATLFGSGKVAEIGKMIAEGEVTLAVVDHPLTPIQQRNLETAWNAKVVDRTGLILEIFGRRAQTREGRMQVELAHLSYQKSRIVRSWTHLERQRGGAGFLGGPGERQLELDRRIIQDKIDRLRVELKDVVRTRELQRAGRRKVPYQIVALAGYTNAGKSTLFNRLTGAKVEARDQVFATLDPTLRQLAVAPGRKVILSDTVGFISDLPTALVAAFRATLEEVVEAALILHVRDISHAESDAQAADVERVLGDLGVDARAADSRILEVWNKIDRVAAERLDELKREAARRETPPILVSAVTGSGFAELLAAIDARLGVDDMLFDITLSARHGKVLSWLHENAEVLERSADDTGELRLRVRVAADARGRLEHRIVDSGGRITPSRRTP
jgi:GTP-binding protein HflX